MAIGTSPNGLGNIDARLSHSTEDAIDWSEIVHSMHVRLLQEMDLAALEKLPADRAREAVTVAARQLLSQWHPSLLGEDRESVLQLIIDEAVGYGPVEPLLNDASISEVMVNAPDEVYYERDGV